MGHVTGGKENRSAPRIKIDAFVKISGDGKEFVFRTRDLSRTGLFLYTQVAQVYPFRVGTTLQLELHDYEQSVAATAVVVRVVEPNSAEADEYPTGFGVRFVKIEGGPERLAELIERIEHRHS
jgi:c-di-GMP-binding flagellar brake protein YcgR